MEERKKGSREDRRGIGKEGRGKEGRGEEGKQGRREERKS